MGVSIPDHRWYYSPRTLQHLLEEAGFYNFRFSEVALRPGKKRTSEYAGPNWKHHLRLVARQPWRALEFAQQYRILRQARAWPLAGLEIMTVSALCSGRSRF